MCSLLPSVPAAVFCGAPMRVLLTRLHPPQGLTPIYLYSSCLVHLSSANHMPQFFHTTLSKTKQSLLFFMLIRYFPYPLSCYFSSMRSGSSSLHHTNHQYHEYFSCSSVLVSSYQNSIFLWSWYCPSGSPSSLLSLLPPAGTLSHTLCVAENLSSVFPYRNSHHPWLSK